MSDVFRRLGEQQVERGWHLAWHQYRRRQRTSYIQQHMLLCRSFATRMHRTIREAISVGSSELGGESIMSGKREGLVVLISRLPRYWVTAHLPLSMISVRRGPAREY